MTENDLKVMQSEAFEVYRNVTIEDGQENYGKLTDILTGVLGNRSYRLNDSVTLDTPSRLEMSVEVADGVPVLVFHGERPTATVAGMARPDVTRIEFRSDEMRVYVNGIIGLIKDYLSVRFS